MHAFAMMHFVFGAFLIYTDTDGSGSLRREEYGTVMKILYAQVLTRILIHWTIVLSIVPIISKFIVKYANVLARRAHETYKDLDDDLDPLQRLLHQLWGPFLS